MSKIASKVGTRYDAISDYFKDRKFGNEPENLTLLSLLPPVDRCLIIERVMECGRCDFMTCIDKLSMAYYKAGFKEVAFEFLEKCNGCGWLRGNYRYFVDKLTDLVVHNVSKTYGDALQKFPKYDTRSFFCRLIRALCSRYQGEELLTGYETSADIDDFVRERRAFIAEMTRNRDHDYIVPSESSGSGMAFTLANTQGIAFSYLLGGGRIMNFRFATSDTLEQTDKEVRDIWEKAESEVRMFAPYQYSARRNAGETAYLVSIEFPCYSDWSYQYRTSRQRISVDDVVDLMFEVMDVKPRVYRVQLPIGEKSFRFSWMFLQDDVERLLGIFPSVRYQHGAWVQMNAVFADMDRILNKIARKAVGVYPFMECEFTGW